MVMKKQIPRLTQSPITNNVYIVTKYDDMGNGNYCAIEKYDITKVFETLALWKQMEN